jgi:hypothetical protein
VGRDNIDASLGLAFSLALFERYRRSGVLQAEIHHVPGHRGRCKGFLHLIEGKVVTCFIEDKKAQRHPISKEILIRTDSDRGPFEWILTPYPAPPSAHPKAEVTLRSTQGPPIPRRIAIPDLDKLEGWTTRQKMMLSIVFDLIDGQLDIEAIKARSPLPPDTTEEALRVLMAMKVIIIL